MFQSDWILHLYKYRRRNKWTSDRQSNHLVYYKTNGQVTSCNWSPDLLKITGVQSIYKATTSTTVKIIAKWLVDASHLTIRIGCQSKEPPPFKIRKITHLHTPSASLDIYHKELPQQALTELSWYHWSTSCTTIQEQYTGSTVWLDKWSVKW